MTGRGTLDLLRDDGTGNKKLFGRYESAFNSCNICALSGRTHHKVKVSQTHDSKAFNVCIQVECTVAYIANETYEILSTVNTETTNREHCIVPSRLADHVRKCFKLYGWIDMEHSKNLHGNHEPFLFGLNIVVERHPLRS